MIKNVGRKLFGLVHFHLSCFHRHLSSSIMSTGTGKLPLLEEGLRRYPTNNIRVEYGTAGFRAKADILDHVFFRMGLLATLRSRCKNSEAVGLMITASHNPEPDNGVKLVDPHGEMLEQAWEKIATDLVNIPDDQVENHLLMVIEQCGIDVSKAALVFLGQDTRPSSKRLAEAAAEGVKAFNGGLVDFGLATTPMIHYYISEFNKNHKSPNDLKEDYLNRFATAFKVLRQEGNTKGNYSPEIDFDGANGIGARTMQEFVPKLGDTLSIRLYNCETQSLGKLNFKCGADFVKTHKALPLGLPGAPNKRCVAVDGDADRIIYFYMDDQANLHLLDGDKIATLVAGYLMELVSKSGLSLNLGLVQTAYANGSSTKYISQALKVPVAWALTGVKHLHHKAMEFDIGVYFEANGHGTVVLKEAARVLIHQAANDSCLPDENRNAAQELSKLIDVINETVGDAISDMLLVENILLAKGWSIQDWEQQYTDLPNTLRKVVVKDRNAVETEGPECRCIRPPGLQEAIEKLVAPLPNARAFVRPSGTEDVVRVYAEADSQEAADSLGHQVSLLVHQHVAGVGDPPTL